MSLEIRLLGPPDEAVLDRVASGVFDRGIQPWLRDEFLADRHHHLCVAVDDGVVVGMITALDYVNPDKPRQLWINEVGVAPSHRRRGIARAMLDAMLAHARDLGCTEAWLATEHENTAANALYRSVGSVAAPAVIHAWVIHGNEG
jgi:aminoglycoside 6'-N-acetyltransferase I